MGDMVDRLEALEVELAVATDVRAILNIRGRIAALIKKSHPHDHDLRHRARALRREAEVIGGQILLLMRQRGEIRGDGGDNRTPKGRSRIGYTDLGFPYRQQASKWMRIGRAAPRSSNVRLAEARGGQPPVLPVNQDDCFEVSS